MSHKTRTLEELVTLQDQAIEALKQALAATQLALECLQKNRNEKGFTIPMDFPVQPVTFPTPFVSPTTVPYVQPQIQPWTPQWGQTWSSNNSGELVHSFLPMDKLVATSGQLSSAVTLDSQYANAEQTLQNAQTSHNVAIAYLGMLQKESHESLHSIGTAHQDAVQHVQGSS